VKTVSKLLSAFFLLTLFFTFSFNAFAEEIKSFDSQIVAHKDGTINVTETIVYDFGSTPRHGIFRDIPNVTKIGDLYRVIKLKANRVDIDGISEVYQDNSNQNALSLKIGNPERTITGVHTYVIFYSVQNGIGSNYEDHDEIFWNVTGNEWEIPIIKSTAEISTDFDTQITKGTCFTGIKNSTEQNCTYSDGTFKTTKILNFKEGFTIVAAFPKDTFPKSILQKMVPNSSTTPSEVNPFFVKIFAFAVLAVPIFLNLILAPILLIWYFKNKRKNRFGKVSVNFDLPEDNNGKRITPAEAGTIDNATLDQNDLVATIFDFAIRKLIRIEQVKSKKVLGIFGDGDDFEFIKIKDLSDGSDFEKTLWAKLFSDRNSVKISSLKSDFYETFSDLSDIIFKILVERNFYSKNPKTQRALILTGAIFSFITLNLFFGGVLIFFYSKLIGRTAKGDEIDFRIDGLKLFLKNMSREHTWQAKNLITVEKYIPYAIALGYVKEFMDELKVIYPDYQPSWYNGNLAFYAISNNMISSMNSNFTTHAPSSSSGFSGGGFSGGGGGGGGGGSW
jgi:hypothetical protein